MKNDFNAGEVIIRCGQMFDNVPDITLQGSERIWKNFRKDIAMKNKIEPKSWKEVAESLDAVDHKDVLQLYEEDREDELEAYYENAAWVALSRTRRLTEMNDNAIERLRDRVGVPYEEDQDAWSWLRGMKRVMNFCLIMTIVNFGLIILVMCLI